MPKSPPFFVTRRKEERTMSSISDVFASKPYFVFNQDLSKRLPLICTMHCEEKTLNCFQRFLRDYLGFYKHTQLNRCASKIIYYARDAYEFSFANDQAREAAATVFKKSLNRSPLPIHQTTDPSDLSIVQLQFSSDARLSKIVFSVYDDLYRSINNNNANQRPIVQRCTEEEDPLPSIRCLGQKPENVCGNVAEKLFAAFS
jgi:hypothetical protein